MSILIDKLLMHAGENKSEIGGSWYESKPIPYVTFYTIIRRIKDAFRVLIGKSYAFHFKQDED